MYCCLGLSSQLRHTKALSSHSHSYQDDRIRVGMVVVRDGSVTGVEDAGEEAHIAAACH